MNRTSSMAWLIVGAVALVAVYASWKLVAEEEGVWRFNFTPAAGPDVESFINVRGDSLYSGWRGFGWVDTTGALEKGQWSPGKDDAWESRSNLNLVLRKGPDDLARSYAAGAARFALDLEPGEYEVWVLSGDSGLLEYTPWQPYRITVEGREAYRYAMTAERFRREFQTPPLADDLTESGVWQRYIEPRFEWSRVTVDVTDGQLDVVVEGDERDRSKVGLAGEYPHTEDKRGPRKRYTGAINALVVISLERSTRRGTEIIADVDQWRYRNFSERWPLETRGARAQANPAPADHERGYTVSAVNPLGRVFPQTRLPHRLDALSLRSAPGQVVSLSLAIQPLRDLGATRVDFPELQGPLGGNETIVSTEAGLDVGVVRYVARPKSRRSQEWRPTPAMALPTDTWSVEKNVTKQFWLNYRVPEQLSPGHYRGTISITPEKAAPSELEVELEVLPFRLQRPKHLALGLTYFSPVQDAWFGESSFWQRMAAEFADMRAQGFTTVQFTGVGIHDYDRLDRVFQLYREAGFEQPLLLLESYGAMDRMRLDGIAWGSEAFFSGFQQSIRQLLAEAERRRWPPLVVNFGDEFTNSALEEFGAEVARRLKEIPGIVTSADSNGYREVELLAPEVDIVAFNNGWAGPERVNGDKRLLHRGTVEMIEKAGAAPWLVNVGTDRFSNGYWLWKMVKLGVRGKLEWMYRSYHGMPYNSFDADPMKGDLAFPGPGGRAIHALEYQFMRMGFDDLAYLYTLEQLLASRRASGSATAAADDAESFLRELDALIEDDMNRYRDDKAKRWPVDRYDALRDEAIDHILALNPNLDRSAEGSKPEAESTP